jgi:hypothetical protein
MGRNFNRKSWLLTLQESLTQNILFRILEAIRSVDINVVTLHSHPFLLQSTSSSEVTLTKVSEASNKIVPLSPFNWNETLNTTVNKDIVYIHACKPFIFLQCPEKSNPQRILYEGSQIIKHKPSPIQPPTMIQQASWQLIWNILRLQLNYHSCSSRSNSVTINTVLHILSSWEWHKKLFMLWICRKRCMCVIG